MSAVFVGVDVGTARVKASAVDARGAVRGESERPTPWRRDAGRCEADPEALAVVARRVAAEAAAECGPAAGVGVTGMAETGVLVDGHDRPLAPAIAWHDPRGDVDTVARELGAEPFQRTTGLPLTALPSLTKLLWLRRHDPGTRQAVRFYSVGEWVVRRLGGAPAAELSLASRTGLLELDGARPWAAAYDLLGSPPLLPDRVLAGTPLGRATGDDVPDPLRGAVLTVAGHDHQVAAYGLGAAADGAVLDSVGTAEALVRSVRAPMSPVKVTALTGAGVSVGWGVVRDHLCVLAGVWTGLTLGRLRTMLGATTPAARRALAEDALAATDHPTLRLVDPEGDQFGLVGVGDGVTPAVLWRTAVEGLVERTRALLARIDAVVGPHREVVVAGGWLRDAALLAAKRRQYPVLRTADVAEPGTYGAAMLAAAAAGTPITKEGQHV